MRAAIVAVMSSDRTRAYPSRLVGRCLQRAFEAKGLRQAEAANELGYARSTFNKWVTGHNHPKGEETWKALATLGCSYEELRIFELLDKLEALRIDLGVSEQDMSRTVTAAEISKSSGETVIEVLRRLKRIAGTRHGQ